MGSLISPKIPAPPAPVAPPVAPTTDLTAAQQEGIKDAMRRRRSGYTKTILTSRGGAAGAADIFKKTLLGQ